MNEDLKKFNEKMVNWDKKPNLPAFPTTKDATNNFEYIRNYLLNGSRDPADNNTSESLKKFNAQPWNHPVDMLFKSNSLKDARDFKNYPPEVQDSIRFGQQEGINYNPAVGVSAPGAQQSPQLPQTTITPPNPANLNAKGASVMTGFDNDPNSNAQSNTETTKSKGGTEYDNGTEQKAINAALGYQDILSQYLIDRTGAKGAFAIDPNMRYSPDQIDKLRSKGDDIYQRRIGDMITAAKDAENDNLLGTTVLASTKDPLARKYLQGALSNKGLFGTNAERKSALSVIAAAPDEEKIALLRGVAENALDLTERQSVATNRTAVAQIERLFKTIPKDFENNPYKYLLQQYVTFIPGGAKNPDYSNIQASLEAINAPLRYDLFGATLTDNELLVSERYLPSIRVDNKAVLINKAKQLQAISEYKIENIIQRKLGMINPNSLDYYFEKAGLSANDGTSAGGGAGGTGAGTGGGKSTPNFKAGGLF